MLPDHRSWQDLFCTLNQLKRFDMYPLDVGHLLRPEHEHAF